MVRSATGQIRDLAIVTKKKTDNYQESQKLRINKEYFNYKIKKYYAQNCCLETIKRKPKEEKDIEETKQAQQTRNQVTKKAGAVQSANQDYNNFDPESNLTGRIFMTRDTNNKAIYTWYLDFYASKYICNNKELYSDICTKNYNFITARSKIISSQKVDKIHFFLQTSIIITLLNIAYTPKCNSNLISLGQLQKLGIWYYNHFDSIISKQEWSTLGMTSNEKHLFVLKIGLIEKAILL